MKNRSIYLGLAATAVFWGANFNVGKPAISIMSPMAVVAWRFIIAAGCMTALIWVWERPSIADIRPYLWIYVALGIIGVFGMNALVFSGLKRTSAINASLIMATNPLVTAVLASLILRERLRLVQIVGMFLSFLGVLFVLTGGSLAALGSVSSGDLMVLAGNTCWALYGTLSRKYLSTAPPLLTTAVTTVVGAACFLPFASTSHTGSSRDELLAWLAIAFMAICGSVLAYIWWNRGIARIGPSKTALFFNLVPVSTMIITTLTGGRVTLPQLLGAVLVITGVVLALTQKQRKGSIQSTQRALST